MYKYFKYSIFPIDAVSSSHYMTSNYMINNDRKDSEGSGRERFKVLSGRIRGGAEERHENLRIASIRYRDLKPVPLHDAATFCPDVADEVSRLVF